MMLVDLLGLGCALLSAAGIAVLAATDPKRRGNTSRSARSGTRRFVWLAALAPGVALGVAGRWSDFLIWVGAAAVLGWGIAVLSNASKLFDNPLKLLEARSSLGNATRFRRSIFATLGIYAFCREKLRRSRRRSSGGLQS